LDDKTGRRIDENTAQEGHGQDGHDEGAGRAHRTAEHRGRQIRKPGSALMASAARGDRGNDDSLVEVG
jgi:hypothetical protein